MGKTRKRSKFFSFFSCLSDKSDDLADELRSTSTPTPSSPQPEVADIKNRLTDDEVRGEKGRRGLCESGLEGWRGMEGSTATMG